MLHMVKNPLTKRGRELLAILRKRGGWLTRNDLATGLDRDELSHHDREMLDRLQTAGYIEVDKRIRDDGGVIAEYIYRATDKPTEDKL